MMAQILLPVLYGAALGAALAIPVRLLCALLLKMRGIPTDMTKKHFAILLAGLALAGGAIGRRAGVTFLGLYLFLILIAAACAFYIDAKHRIIPNELVLAVPVFTAIFGFTGAIPFQIWQSLLGLAVCFVIFFVPSLFGKNIGAGDVKFAAAMGFALGLTGSLYAIVCMGALVLVYTLLDKRLPLSQRLKTMIPMGPFLALALVVVLLVIR
jgi:prepilin signal peptidase PulO-like enzyme (type II secretory pathway)